MTLRSPGPGQPGKSATIAVGSVSTGPASVTNVGTPSNAVFNFVLPQGAAGNAATVAVGTVTTGAAGSQAAVTNSGSNTAAVLNFTLPRGATGNNAPNPAFTVSASGLAAGAQPTVNLSGTYPNLTLAFGIPAGAGGNTPANPVFTASASTLAAGVSATASVSGSYPNLNIAIGVPQGASGSNATATPLGSTAPQPLGTAAAGTSTNASREDHVHPLPAGRLQLVGTATVSETMLVSLSLGVARRSITMSGVNTSDRLIAILTGQPTAGCELFNVYPTAANTLSVGLLLPALGIGATFSVPIAVYRIT